MKTFNLTIKGREIPVYVDKLTKQMGVRFGSELLRGNMFEICCDKYHDIWCTNIGIYGKTIEELIMYYIKYTSPNMSCVNYIYVCDDMQVFDMPSEPVTGMISYNEVKDIDSKTIKW